MNLHNKSFKNEKLNDVKKQKTFFFLNWQNFINQRTRARRTNRLGWRKKKYRRGNRLPYNVARTKTPLKTTPKKGQQFKRNDANIYKIQTTSIPMRQD
jgi:hypothetical protein